MHAGHAAVTDSVPHLTPEQWRSLVPDLFQAEGETAPDSGPAAPAPAGRIGNWLIYRHDRFRFMEYCPSAIVTRDDDGALRTRDPRWADAFREALMRVKSKAMSLSMIRHRGLLPIRGVRMIEHAGLVVGAIVTTEPADSTLAQLLTNSSPVPPGNLVAFARSVADVLSALHRAGQLHLDLRPETIALVGKQVLMLDGLGIDERLFMPLIESQDASWHAAYTPMELSDGSGQAPLSAATDVYQASALIYRLAVGRDAPTWDQRLREPDAIEAPADADSYPPTFFPAIVKGLAVRPEQRFATIEAWRAALGGDVPPPPPPRSDPVEDEPEGQITDADSKWLYARREEGLAELLGKRKATFAGLAAAVLLAGAAATYALMPKSDPPVGDFTIPADANLLDPVDANASSSTAGEAPARPKSGQAPTLASLAGRWRVDGSQDCDHVVARTDDGGIIVDIAGTSYAHQPSPGPGPAETRVWTTRITSEHLYDKRFSFELNEDASVTITPLGENLRGERWIRCPDAR